MAGTDERIRLLQDLDAAAAGNGSQEVDPAGDQADDRAGDVAAAPPDALAGRLLRTHEVALLFQVSERAVTDWASRGRLPSVRTPGGHRRYPAHAVLALLRDVGLR